MMTMLGSNITLTDCLVLIVNILIFREDLPINLIGSVMWNLYLKASFELVVAKKLADHRLFLVPGSKTLAAHKCPRNLVLTFYLIFLSCDTFFKHPRNMYQVTTGFRKTFYSVQ